MLFSLFHDGLVLKEELVGYLCKCLLENPSWLYQCVGGFPWSSWFIEMKQVFHIASTCWLLLPFILLDISAHSQILWIFQAVVILFQFYLFLELFTYISVLFNFSSNMIFFLLPHHSDFWTVFHYCASTTVSLNSLQAALKYSVIPFSFLESS